MRNSYNVYGIGNALVDIEFKVSEALLQRLKIDKSVMTLIDLERHDALLCQLSALEPIRACGGSCANTMIAFSQFGGKSFYSCRVADDAAGHFFLEDLKKQGVAANRNASIDSNSKIKLATGKCLVFATPDADRTMNTYLGISEDLTCEQIDLNVLEQAQYLYIEGYLVSSELSRNTAIKTHEAAKHFGLKTALTLSDRNMTHYFLQGLIDMIGTGVDFLFSNEEEAKSFCQVNTFDEAVCDLKKYAKQFVITRGAKGAFLFDGKRGIHVKARPVQVLDTLGAGDIYVAGILYGLTHALPLTTAATLASEAAAVMIQKFGPRLTRQESQAIFRRVLGPVKEV